MKKYISIIALTLFLTSITQAQTLIKYREATLESNGYDTAGKAILEAYSDGSVKLRLDENYETETGPDVVLFLSDQPAPASGVEVSGIEVVNLGNQSGISHFSGEKSFDLPSSTTIEEYDYVVLQCVFFGRLPWGKGSFGKVNDVEVTDIFSFTKKESLSFYPNPADEQILFNDNVLNLNLYDSLGNLIETYSNVSKINTAKLPDGVYIIEDDKNKKSRLIITH